MISVRSALAACLLLLAGCSDIPQSHAYLLLSDRLDERSHFILYRDELDSPDIARLRGKVNFAETYYARLPACDRLSGDGYPTPAESAALRRWAAVRAAYFERFHALELQTASASDKVAPLARRYVAAMEEDLDYSTALINDLAAGKMTFCEFATRQNADIVASSARLKPLREDMLAAMIDDYYFDGTGLARHPGKVKQSFGITRIDAGSGPVGSRY